MQLLMPSGFLILGTIRRRYFLIRGDNLLLMLILLLSGRGGNRPLLLMTLVSCCLSRDHRSTALLSTGWADRLGSALLLRATGYYNLRLLGCETSSVRSVGVDETDGCVAALVCATACATGLLGLLLVDEVVIRVATCCGASDGRYLAILELLSLLVLIH